mmetsp:Transcript_22909/g.50320  ORF Transcript_22909/g.50320 Transcript_22909/m.50320 type:complete len:392 (-) Transcript_22909:48-1223(-)
MNRGLQCLQTPRAVLNRELTGDPQLLQQPHRDILRGDELPDQLWQEGGRVWVRRSTRGHLLDCGDLDVPVRRPPCHGPGVRLAPRRGPLRAPRPCIPAGGPLRAGRRHGAGRRPSCLRAPRAPRRRRGLRRLARGLSRAFPGHAPARRARGGSHSLLLHHRVHHSGRRASHGLTAGSPHRRGLALRLRFRRCLPRLGRCLHHGLRLRRRLSHSDGLGKLAGDGLGGLAAEGVARPKLGQGLGLTDLTELGQLVGELLLRGARRCALVRRGGLGRRWLQRWLWRLCAVLRGNQLDQLGLRVGLRRLLQLPEDPLHPPLHHFILTVMGEHTLQPLSDCLVPHPVSDHLPVGTPLVAEPQLKLTKKGAYLSRLHQAGALAQLPSQIIIVDFGSW